MIVGKLAMLIAVMALGLALSAGAVAAAPTKAQFIRQGDVLCRQVQQELMPLVRRAQAAKSLPAGQQWAAAESLWAEQIRIQVRFTAASCSPAAYAMLLHAGALRRWPSLCRSTFASRCR